MESSFGYHSSLAKNAEGSASSLEPTVDSYFRAFAPAPNWDDCPTWPPDVFAISNLVLDHTEAYRCAVSPHGGGTAQPLFSSN